MNQPPSSESSDPSLSKPAKVTSSENRKVDITRFVTAIKNPEQQVGEHIIHALKHDETVAVLTTVAVGADGQQRVISAALNAERMQQVQEILTAAEEEREPEEPCVGFHCLIKPKNS